MNTSFKFAGKNDSNVVTPVSVSDEGHIREERKFNNSEYDIVNEVLAITEKTAYPSYDARNSGLISIVVLNRSGVSLDLQFNTPKDYSAQGISTAVYNVKGEPFIFTIPSGRLTVITPEDLPMLNYAQYINISLTPSGTPTGTAKTLVRIFDKR